MQQRVLQACVVALVTGALWCTAAMAQAQRYTTAPASADGIGTDRKSVV